MERGHRGNPTGASARCSGATALGANSAPSRPQVVRCAWLGSVWSLSQQSTSVALSCGRCGRRTRPHAPCERCQPRHVPDTCSVCHKARPALDSGRPTGGAFYERRVSGGSRPVRVVPGLRARRPLEAHAGVDGHAHAVPRRLRAPLSAGVNADPARSWLGSLALHALRDPFLLTLCSWSLIRVIDICTFIVNRVGNVHIKSILSKRLN